MGCEDGVGEGKEGREKEEERGVWGVLTMKSEELEA